MSSIDNAIQICKALEERSRMILGGLFVIRGFKRVHLDEIPMSFPAVD
jgi:hypothetical protein